jgi:hypothetical protein
MGIDRDQGDAMEGEGGFVSTLCIDCALSHPDFREVTRRRELQRQSEAMIGGEKYTLSRVGVFHVACDQCGRVNDRLYVLSQPHGRQVA